MSLIISQSPKYFAPCEHPVLGEEGKLQTHLFDGQFKRLKTSQIQQLNEDIAAGKCTDAQLLERVMVGWRGVENLSGPMPFTPENFALAEEEMPGLKQAFVRGYIASTSPTASAHLLEKNS